MNEFLNKIEIEVSDETEDIVFCGKYEDFLALNNYEEVLEETLNKLQSNNIKNLKYVNDFGETLIIKKVNYFE